MSSLISRPVRISIHASRVGGDDSEARKRRYCEISIHASRVGGDAIVSDRLNNKSISIHASRVGGDAGRGQGSKSKGDFNPRLPGGRRRVCPAR